MEKRRKVNTDQPLNVTPLIDVLSAIVFFLMLSISFVRLRVVAAAIPQTSESNDLDTEVALTINVQMGEYGFRVQARDPTKEKSEKRDFAKKGAAFDYDGLSVWLRDIKLAHPKSDSVIMVPEADVPLTQIVEAMDACREAPSKSGAGMIPTFPKVVLSSLVK